MRDKLDEAGIKAAQNQEGNKMKDKWMRVKLTLILDIITRRHGIYLRHRGCITSQCQPSDADADENQRYFVIGFCFIVSIRSLMPNDPTLSRGQRRLTFACNLNSQVSNLNQNLKGGGRGSSALSGCGLTPRHRNNPARLNGPVCAPVSAHSTSCCRDSGMTRQSDYPPRHKEPNPAWSHW
jgi:hypothetical protein